MKTKSIAVLSALLFLFPGMIVSASASCGGLGPGTIWEPTESGNIDINYSGFEIYGKIAIFDDQASLLDSDPHFILQGNPGFGIVWDSIELLPVGDDFGIRRAGMPNTPRVILEGSNRFQVAMKVNNCWLPGFSTGVAGTLGLDPAYGQHAITWDGFDALLIQVDAQPVPIPGAIYMLGVGLAGLALFKKSKA